ncbi:hypothetical protein SARC_10023 [Sphaeroforma arctica JP610]|uniref:Uncharacterized protein n=1 Tax=Sphaeroforma arctica JP610 TaxID=667725 RepID=A0A0L0FM16_9EUKA|nr:hypothetical protein SARC_10023 [Sphaeroforma arctica JP610]KNC77521.1 hypothetical protein SARC_10023 [Sphaeroforma arctica JP610]|eukprot:XP_014151423.1 hypothetical protein SARC_10023 [Sphaeroforma arctica JP610]
MCTKTDTEVRSETTILRRLSKIQVVSDVYEIAANFCQHAKEQNHYFAVAAENTEKVYCKVCGIASPYLSNEHIANVDQILVSNFDQIVEKYPQITTTPLADIVSTVQVAIANTKQMVSERIMGPTVNSIEAMPTTAEGVEEAVNQASANTAEVENTAAETTTESVIEPKSETNEGDTEKAITVEADELKSETIEDDSEIATEEEVKTVPMKDDSSSTPSPTLTPEKRSRSNSSVSRHSLKQRANSLILNIPRHGVAI